MPSPKSGTAGSAVSPAAPDPALDADDAIAGALDQTQANPATAKAGTLDSVQVAPAKPYKPDPLKKSWIEIKLIDEKKNPVPGEPYSVTLPDSTVASGTLDDKGFARIDGIDPGTCQITFPQRDGAAWKKV
jgi:type VI secretion system secreted protein VgrG